MIDQIFPIEPILAYERACELLRQDATTPDQVAAVVRKMPVLAVHALARANSAEFTGRMRIDRLDRALIVLGRPIILEIATELLEKARTDEFDDFKCPELINHLVTVSQASVLMARASRLPLHEEVRAAAIIHDLGIAVQIVRHPQEMSSALADSRRTGARLVEHERLVLGTDHCEALEEILRQSGFPSSMVDAVGFHHDPLSSPAAHRYLAMLLYAGECLAHRAGSLDAGGHEAPRLEDKILTELRLTKLVMDGLATVLRNRLGRLKTSQRTAY